MAPTQDAPETVYDMLPEGAPGDVAGLFYSALDLPGVADWLAADREDLLNVVTLRYKNRLIDRAPAASPRRARRYVERLAQSALAEEFPNAVTLLARLLPRKIGIAGVGSAEWVTADAADSLARRLIARCRRRPLAVLLDEAHTQGSLVAASGHRRAAAHH